MLNLFLIAAVQLAAPFKDNMVLQREMKVPVWGRAALESKVTVEFAGQKLKTTVDREGKWAVELAPLATSAENRELKVTEQSGAGESTVSVKNVLVGEVWFASGQSNMECGLWNSATRYRDMAGGVMVQITELPLVRYLRVPHAWGPTVTTALKGDAIWHPMTSAHLKANGISAVAFYYARELYLALQIPIGIVEASWGGTNIDAWTPHSAYATAEESIRAVGDLPILGDKEFWQSHSNGVYAAENRKCGIYRAPIQQPSALWNGNVGAFVPMAMRGFIWYQGCHNHGENHRYRAKMHALYEGWRKEFRNPELKLYFVQLAPFTQNWLGTCMAQTQFAEEEPNAELAVTADLGNFRDIHPNRKEAVAKRLVIHALKRDYGFKGIEEDCSPVCKKATFRDGKAILEFDHVKSWYIYHPDYVYTAPFQLAGKDGKWEDAKIVDAGPYDTRDVRGVLKGVNISLKSEKVPEPVKARYMGEPRTFGTMFNEASLPLGPFEIGE